MSTPSRGAAKPKTKPKTKTHAPRKAKPAPVVAPIEPEVLLNPSRSGEHVHKPLTDQQAMFCEQYIVDFNGAAAARRAGYSEKTAREQAYDLLTKPHIQLRVRQLRREAVKNVRFNKDMVLERLSNELEADLADLYDENDRLLPVSEWPLVWRTGLVVGVETEELYEGTGEDRVHIGQAKKLKIESRHKKIELAGKHVDVLAFKERSEVEVGGTLQQLLNTLAGTALGPTQAPPVVAAAPMDPLRPAAGNGQDDWDIEDDK